MLKGFLVVTILLTAVSMSAAFAHLLEMPAKMTYDGELWLTLLQTLYPPAFGPVAGTAEIAALAGMLVLVFAVRGTPAFRWTLAAAACMAAAHAAFWIWNAPVNAILVPADTLPDDWEQLRNRWEYSHALRAVLELGALAALVMSIMSRYRPRASSAKA